MKTVQREQCYCCEREILPHEGQWVQIFHNDFETQALMCHACIEEDEKLCEGHDWQEEEDVV